MDKVQSHRIKSLAHLEHTMHVTDQLGRYDMILGRDLLQELVIDLDFKENSIVWGDYQVNMKSAVVMLTEHLVNVEATKDATANIAKMA
eukprot:1648251-Ditylum_brightwellii.AAC.3